MVGQALLNRFQAEQARQQAHAATRGGWTYEGGQAVYRGGDLGGIPTYTDASWKNIPFKVENSTDEFGRRGDVYEYPLGNEVGYKDLGRKARRYKLEGYLIGTNQAVLTRQMIDAAESPEPGPLDHPMMGANQLVACVTLTVTADYRRDKRRTKLSFEFVEASPSLGALEVGKTIEEVWDAGTQAVDQSTAANASATFTEPEGAMTQHIRDYLAERMRMGRGSQPGYGVAPQGQTFRTVVNGQEQMLDAEDWLTAATSEARLTAPTPFGIHPIGGVDFHAVELRTARAPQARAVEDFYQPPATFRDNIAPIDYASSVIREFLNDALDILRNFNRFVVSQQEATPTAQALIMTIRLIILRDFAIAAAQHNYETIRDALVDLDFIVAAYDDEERVATEQCNDVLVNLIYRARAAAASAILANAIRLPGIAEFPVDGVWPSVVCAWKIYADSRRHEQLERYNPQMNSFFMGRDLVAPAR